MNLTMYERILGLYGQHVFKRSALSIRQGAGVIEWAMAGKGYRTALEIGSYRGVGAAEMSQYCERVVTLDLRHGRMEQLGETHDREAYWRSLGIDNICSSWWTTTRRSGPSLTRWSSTSPLSTVRTTPP